MTAQQVATIRNLICPTYVAAEPLSPFFLGRRDAADGLDCQPSSYFVRKIQRIEYVSGYASVKPVVATITMRGTDCEVAPGIDAAELLAALLAAFVGEDELAAMIAEYAEAQKRALKLARCEYKHRGHK